MNAIFSVDKNWAIGRENELLFRASEDLKNFRRMTTGNVVIMGRNTLLSLPHGRPLPNRTNLVLSTQRGWEPEGVAVFASLAELLEHLREIPADRLFVIGGEQVYRQLLPYCSRAYATRFLAEAQGADCFLPDLDADPCWTVEESGEIQSENGLEFQFVTYHNTQPKPWR